MDERRQHPRAHASLPIHIRDQHAVRMITALVKDISAGGIRFVVDGDFWPVGTSLIVEIPLAPASPHFRSHAHVRHISLMPNGFQHSVGIQFDNVSSNDAARLNRYLKEKLGFR